MDNPTNEELVELIQGGETAELGTLYQRNRGLLYKICIKYSGQMETDDLMQEAYLAMRDAAISYDKDKGASFAHYLSKRVEWHLIAYLGETSMIRIPQSLRQELSKRRKITGALSLKGISPSDTLVDSLTGARYSDRIERGAMAAASIISLQAPLHGDTDGMALEDTLKDDRDYMAEVEDCIDRDRMSAEIWHVVDDLPENQANVIRQHYLYGKKFIEIGDGSKAVNETHKTALRNLRKIKYRKQLENYYQWIFGGALKGSGARRFAETWTSSTEYIAMLLADREQGQERPSLP